MLKKSNSIYTSKLILFLGCRFVSTVSEQLLLFAIPLIIFQYTGEASKSGLAFLIEWLPAVLLLPFIGVLVDIYKEKKLYIIGDSLRALVSISGFLLLIYMPSQTFIILSVAASLFAILNSLNFVTLETTIGRNFDNNDIPRIQSLIQGLELSSQVIGPALASILVLFIKEMDFLIITGIAFAMTGFGVLGLPNKAKNLVVRETKSFKRVLVTIGDGFKFIAKNFFLRLLVLATMLINLVMGTVMALNPAVAQGVLGATSREYSLLAMFGGITGSIVVLLIPVFLKKSKSINNIGIASIVLLTLSGVVLGIANQFYIYVIGYALLVCGIGIFNVFLRTERVKLIPKHHLGKSMGTIVFFNRLSLPLAGLITSTFTKITGPQEVILGVSIFWIIVNSTIFTYYFYNKRHAAKDVLEL
ncbi:MFS transporter [Bacillus amyloliquefaciens]|nr:MFS transporter [Bacillus amyloliquefaciens]